MSDVHCRVATTADVPALSGMMQQFYTEQSLVFTTNTIDAMRTLINSPALGYACLVEAAGVPVGYFVLTFFFSLERSGRAALLDELFILPAERNRGHGREALRAAIDLTRQSDCRSIHLEVDRANIRARKLYETVGFLGHEHVRDFLTLPL